MDCEECGDETQESYTKLIAGEWKLVCPGCKSFKSHNPFAFTGVAKGMRRF